MKSNHVPGRTVITSGHQLRLSYKPSSCVSSVHKNGEGSREDDQLCQQQRKPCFLNGKSRIPASSSHPTSPFVVNRGAKYVSSHARFRENVRGYAKYYVVIPACLFADRCKHVFYQLCGLLLLVAVSPLMILIFLGLFVLRRLRWLLIQRLYPGLSPVDDHSISYKPSEANQSAGVDIVNSLVWMRGKLDLETIRKRFKSLFHENPQLHHLLGLKLVSKLGATLWEASDSVIVEEHIVEAPKKFQNCPIIDEPLKELYRNGSNKSSLQKYVSYCVSLPMEQSLPPWKIHVVSYISRDDGIKEKTCLVIRMHVALLKNNQVRNALRELFVNFNVSQNQLDGGRLESPDHLFRVASKSETSGHALDSCQETKNVVQYEKWTFETLKQLCTGEKLKEISSHHQKNLAIWMDLRLKQLDFHPKSLVMSIVLSDVKDAVNRYKSSFEVFLSELWNNICIALRYFLEVVQALASIPMLILSCVIRGAKFNKLGLRRNVNPSRRLISWSDLIYSDLVEEIYKQTGTSSAENVIMMACTYALRDYYQQINIPNPGKLGFNVVNSSSSLASSMKAIRVPCSLSKYSSKPLQDLQNVEESLSAYPSWKMLGLWYTINYSSYFMPTCLAQRIHRLLVSSYPFTLSHVSVNSMDSFLTCHGPIHQIYGEIVEEFAYWQLPPMSDFGVSITMVQYSGKTRLFVMSPFQSMDTILTQRCNQYLIRIAEDVGVERNRIPYSRRSSPTSSSCSTPQNPSYFLNQSLKCNFEFKERV